MFKEFVKALDHHKRIGVFSHVRPDGDCIGAQVALCRWLQKNGFEAFAFNDDDVSENLTWLCDVFPVQKPAEEMLDLCDLFIVVDGNAPGRFGSYEAWQKAHPTPVLMVDHHPDPEDAFTVAVSVDKASSTCELIYQLYKEHNIEQIDPDIAKALYTGMITDTGSFQYDSVTPKTMEAAADILRRGNFTPNEVAEKVFSNRTLPQLRLLSLSLDRIKLFENNQIAVMSVTQSMLNETGTTNADTEGLVNYPLSISGVKAAILIKDLDEDGIKMSLRSRSDINVNEWARELGGGGHKKAAGAWHKGPLEEAIRETVYIGAKQLKNSETTAL
ncbi:MAG: bifunctional oligoribonuclease/PAP phosphatase NrnA [Balneolaceae bacterium]